MTHIVGQLVPFFALVAVGYFCKRRQWVGTTSLMILTRLVLFVFLPAVLVTKISSTSIDTLLNGSFVAAYLLSAFLIMIVGGGFAYVFFKVSFSEAAFTGLSGAYGNIGFFAIPVLVSVVGEWISVPLALILILDLVILVPVVTFILQLGETTQHEGAFTAKLAIKRALINPLIIAIAIGLFFSSFNLQIPSVIYDGLFYLGKAAGPCAMFIVGVSLGGIVLSRRPVEAIYMTSLKLLIYPVLVALMMHLFSIESNWVIAAILAAAMPCAAILTAIAEEYKTMPAQSSAAILISTVVSAATLPLLIGYLIP